MSRLSPSQTTVWVHRRFYYLHAGPAHVRSHAGAQVLVAWSLQQSQPGNAFSMVAEEDSADLRRER